jgi:hypothetical protein
MSKLCCIRDSEINSKKILTHSLIPLVLSASLQQVAFLNRWDSLTLMSLLGIYVSIFNLMTFIMILNHLYLLEEAKKAEAEDDYDYSDMPELISIDSDEEDCSDMPELIPIRNTSYSCSHTHKLNDETIRYRVKETQEEYIKRIYPGLEQVVNDTNHRNFQKRPVEEDVILRRSSRILNKSQKEA